MKQIGHVDDARTEQAWRTHSLGMLSPHDLFIPDPGERENVSADQWTLAGWVIPDKDGGTIYTNHRDASEDGDARPAYVRRLDPDRVEMQEDGTYRLLPVRIDPGTIRERDPMDVRRSEFDALTKRFDLLAESTNSRIWALEKIRHQRAGSGHMMTESMDRPTPFKRIVGPSIQSKISTDELISEALEFCDTELGGWDGVDVETGCERAGVYIRELVRRLQSPSSTATDGLGSIVHEPPMSFYDGAFIAAYMDLRSADYDDITRIQRAHAIAAKLTRNRAVPA
jgi:hypothetical protein